MKRRLSGAMVGLADCLAGFAGPDVVCGRLLAAAAAAAYEAEGAGDVWRDSGGVGGGGLAGWQELAGGLATELGEGLYAMFDCSMV